MLQILDNDAYVPAQSASYQAGWLHFINNGMVCADMATEFATYGEDYSQDAWEQGAYEASLYATANLDALEAERLAA